MSQPLPEQRARLDALYHLGVELSTKRSLDSVLRTALQQCLELTDSQFGFVGLITADGESMEVVATEGFHPDAAFYQHFRLIPLRPNIFSHVVLHDRPIRSVDAREDPRRVGQPQHHPPVHAFLGVPLRDQDRPIGMIGVANRPVPYNDEHEQLLSTYAAQIGIVIRNAQLVEALQRSNEDLEQKVTARTAALETAQASLAQKARQLQQLLSETVDVQEAERQRIAQGMHDGMNQLLIGAMLELRSAEQRLINADAGRAQLAVAAAKDILHQVDNELKHIIHDLRPPTLDALGLGPALKQLTAQFERYAECRCELQLLGHPRRLPSRIEISVYRLVQESLHNIQIHARATHVTVMLVFANRTLKVSITDNGVGFDVSNVAYDGAAHLGLLGMHERAEALGGNLSLESSTESGTRVALTIPLPSPSESAS